MDKLPIDIRKAQILSMYEPDLEKGGVGSGRVIGHTKLGSKVYENYNHPSHKDFTSSEHLEASNIHADLNNPKSTLTHTQSDEASAHHFREHEKREKAEEGLINEFRKKDPTFLGQNKIQKSEEETISQLKKSIEDKNNLNKAFDILNDKDMLCKAIGRTGLTPKKVTVTMKNGQTHQAIRWVNEHDEAPSLKHVYKNVGEDVTGDNSEQRIHNIVNHDSMSPDLKVKNLAHEGIYDKDTLSNLTGAAPQKAYDILYNAGVKHKEFRDDHKALLGGSEILPKDPVTGVQVPVSMAIHEAKEALKTNDFEKYRVEKQRELAAKYGVSMDNRWEAYNRKLRDTIQVGYPRSLIAFGLGGLGKTYDFEQIAQELELRQYDDDPELGGMDNEDEYDYVLLSGSLSKTDMWRQLCQHKNKLIVFDDLDSIWDTTGGDDMVNWLKKICDTTGDGVVRNGNGDKVKDINGEPCPRMCKFRGRIISITNLKASDLPQPLIDSRSGSIDLTMNMDQTLEKIDKIKYKIKLKDDKGEEITASKEDRELMVDFLKEFKDYLRIEQVNGRTAGQIIGDAQSLRRLGKFSKEEFYKAALISLRIV